MHDEGDESISVITIPFIVILIALFCFIGLLRKERDLALWGICILSVIGCAKIWSLAGLKGLTCRPVPNSSRLFPGDTLTLHLTVENRKFLPVMVRTGILIESGGLEIPEGTPFHRESGLLLHQRADFIWTLRAARRGVYLLGPFTIEAGDFFGFFRKNRKENPIAIIVYPKISALTDFDIPSRDFFGKSGKSSPVQDPVYILGTREYQHQQPARYIHWKAGARRNKLMEKIFEPSEQKKILLAVDAKGFAESGAEDAFEKILEAAASLAVHLERQGFMTGLITNAALYNGGNTFVRPGRNPRQLTLILETMARMKMDCGIDLKDVLKGVSFSSGLSAVIFALSADVISAQGTYFISRGIPFTGIAAEVSEKSRSRGQALIHSLESFLFRDEAHDVRK